MHLFSLTCRYWNNEHESDFANSLGLDFERVIYIGEFSNDEGMKNDELPSDLLRLVAQDEKQIFAQPRGHESYQPGDWGRKKRNEDRDHTITYNQGKVDRFALRV